MVENSITDNRRKIAGEVAKNVVLTGTDVLAGCFMSTVGLIIGAPIMGGAGILIGTPAFRQGATDLHNAAVALKKYRELSVNQI